MRLRRCPFVAVVTLFFLLVSSTLAFAAIPIGTVIFGNGQALDLGYANNSAHKAEVVQDVVSSSGLYVKTFAGQVINNSTGTVLTNLSALPAVTYKDVNGNIKHFAAGDGPEVGSTTATVSSVLPVSVNTTVGTAPVLPATVTATMSDGTTSNVTVTWAAVTTSQYATAGNFAVTGTIANSSITATAKVTVTTADSAGTITVTGQLVGTGALNTPAVATVNTGVTVSRTVSAANASITYLVSSPVNITAKDSNGNTLVATYLNSQVCVSNDIFFDAYYTVPADASGNVKATFTSFASSQALFNVVIRAPFSNNGQPVQSDVASIEWGVPGTMILNSVSPANNPACFDFSTSDALTRGLVPVSATILPTTGSTTAVSGQPVKFTMTKANSSTDASAYFTDSTGTTNASGTVVGKGNPNPTITSVVNTDANGQALVYLNSNLPIDKSGVADLGAIMAVGVQAQLVNGSVTTNTGCYRWGAAAQPTKIGNVNPSAMLNPTGLEGGGTITSDSAETATSGSQLTLSGTLQDLVGNPVSDALVAIQDYDVVNGSSNNIQNDAYVLNGTTTLFSAVNYPTVTTDSKGNFSITVTANVPVTQSILNSVTRYYAYYIPPTITVTTGQSLPITVTPLPFVGNCNNGNFINLVWQQGQTIQAVGVSHTALMPNYATVGAVPKTASFTNVVGSDEQMYAAAYNQNGSTIAPAAGNQFDSFALAYDLTAPIGINFEKLGTVLLPTEADGTGISRFTATYNQFKGFVLNTLYYADGRVCYSDGTAVAAVPMPIGYDPTAYAVAYDGSGQLHFYLNSDQTSAIKTSGTVGSVNVNINAYSNTSFNGVIDTNHAQGSATGTINSSFTLK